jgi:hypothetical protein
MGNDYENIVMIHALVPNILSEIITYLKTTYDYSYYGKVKILNTYKTAFEFSIITKNQPFNELEEIFKKYENQIFIKNIWTDKEDGFSGIEIFDSKRGGHNTFLWFQPADIYVNQIPTSWNSINY